jgi:hypothetical protein
VENAPFRLYCNHFIRASERTGERALSLLLAGGETCFANLALVRLKRRKLPAARLMTSEGDTIRPHARSSDRIEFRVPANSRCILTWD